MTAPAKKKVLIVGNVESDIATLTAKLTALNSSKAGPFDMCFATGPFFATTSNSNIGDSLTASPLPIPTYFIDLGVPPASIASSVDLKVTEASSPYNTTPPSHVTIAPNLHYLYAKCHLTTVEGLVVAWMGKNCSPDDLKATTNRAKHGSYLGCDLLLTSEWGQGVLSLLPAETIAASLPNADLATFGDCDVADLAASLRPRYHFSSTHSLYIAAAPYQNGAASGSVSHERLFHATRFIALSSVSATVDSKDKSKKFVHAVGIETLTHMDRGVLLTNPPNTQPNPYHGQNYAKTSDSAAKGTYGVSDASARAMMMDDANAEQYRWGGRDVDNSAGGKRKREDGDGKVENSSDTLHISGLNRDPGGVVNSDSIQACLGPDVVAVRLPPGKNFGFVQFKSHALAKKNLQSLHGGLNVGGVRLNMKWANGASSGGDNASTARDMAKQSNTLTEKDCPDSETLFVIFPKAVPSEYFEDVTEKIRLLSEQCLEAAINGDGASEDRVTAKEEPALAVMSKLAGGGKGFCFMGFASHAAAAMAVAAMTGATDGGNLLDEFVAKQTELDKICVYWSKADIKTVTEREEDSKGLNFNRVRYPADNRTDCWFCLASAGCEKHLIVDVGESVYVAQPKGPLVKTHSLIVPLAHDGVGSFVGGAAEEVKSYVTKLVKHARNEGDELFVFERAVETRGGYHSHVQCIPVEREKVPKLHEMVKHGASKLGVPLKELQNEGVSMKAIVDGCEYFYMEVPNVGGAPSRFAVKLERGAGGKIPLQFGREIAAVALGMSERGHWKACVESEDVEKATAMSFRESFAKLA